MTTDLSALKDQAGFVAACLVDLDTGFVLAEEKGTKGFDLDVAAAANVDVLRAKMAAMRIIGVGDEPIEDIVITQDTQYHMIHPLESNPDMFLYLAVERRTANLGMALLKLRSVEGMLKL